MHVMTHRQMGLALAILLGLLVWVAALWLALATTHAVLDMLQAVVELAGISPDSSTPLPVPVVPTVP